MDESKFKPSDRSPSGSGVSMHPNAREALDELLRRIMVLGQARYVYEGLAIRMATDAALELQDTMLNDPRYKNHKGNGAFIDVFETPDGFHVSVIDMAEKSVLRAELGTTLMPLQPLWGPRERREERRVVNLGEDLAKVVVERAGTGNALGESDLDEIQPYVEPTTQPGLDALRQIVTDRQALMAKEES